jgi:hypothetical protein
MLYDSTESNLPGIAQFESGSSLPPSHQVERGAAFGGQEKSHFLRLSFKFNHLHSKGDRKAESIPKI